MTDRTEVQLYDGRESLEVVGESFYQDALQQLVGGIPGERARVDVLAVLVADENNQYDANAVSVWVNGLKVGHLSRAEAKRMRPGLSALEHDMACPIALPV